MSGLTNQTLANKASTNPIRCQEIRQRKLLFELIRSNKSCIKKRGTGKSDIEKTDRGICQWKGVFEISIEWSLAHQETRRETLNPAKNSASSDQPVNYYTVKSDARKLLILDILLWWHFFDYPAIRPAWTDISNWHTDADKNNSLPIF